MTESANLPALITNQGGAVVSVLSWQQHLEVLTKPQQLKVGMIVKRYPDLNNEAAVDMLADAAGHYGEELDKWFESVVSLHGIESVYLAIEMLHALGLRGENTKLRSSVYTRFENEQRFDLDEMLGLIQTLGETGREFESVDELHRCIDRLGGWNMARLLDIDQIEALLGGEVELAEMRDLVGAPDEGDENDGKSYDDDDEE